MKNIKFVYVLIFVSVFFTSCEELLDLLEDPRDAFTGSWLVEENNTLKSVDFYTVTIEKSGSDSTIVFINNFYAISPSVRVSASVSGGTIRVSSQTVSGFTIQGTGEIAVNDKSIDWNYTVDHNNGFVDRVTAVYTKDN